MELNVIKYMENYFRHTHNGIDSEKLLINNAIEGFPLAALTADVGGSLSSGGAEGLTNGDNAIINNMRTRINELEARLQAIEALL